MHTSDLFEDTEKYLASSNKSFLAGDQIKTNKWIQEGYTKIDRSNINKIVYEFIKRKRKEDDKFAIINLSVNRDHTKYEVILRYIENDNNEKNINAAAWLDELASKIENEELVTLPV